MKSWATKSSAIGALSLVAALASGCGENRPSTNDEPSAPEWTQSRSGSTRYAYLQAADLTDEFLFGASVIKVTDFQSSALDMLVNPMKVKLKLRGTSSSRKLDVSTPTGELLMSFNVKVTGTKYEVDFASAGNDVQLRGLIDQLGGAYTAGSNDGKALRLISKEN